MPSEKGKPQIKGWIEYWETNGFIKSVLWLLSLWIVNIDIKVGFWSVLSLLQHVFSESLPLVCVVITHKKLNLENDVIQKVLHKAKEWHFHIHVTYLQAVGKWSPPLVMEHPPNPASSPFDPFLWVVHHNNFVAFLINPLFERIVSLCKYLWSSSHYFWFIINQWLIWSTAKLGFVNRIIDDCIRLSLCLEYWAHNRYANILYMQYQSFCFITDKFLIKT
jgi:hypothetical protein